MKKQKEMNLYQIIQQQFESECDVIQAKTEELLTAVPKHDLVRRKKILDLHKLKLREALLKLNHDLKSI